MNATAPLVENGPAPPLIQPTLFILVAITFESLFRRSGSRGSRRHLLALFRCSSSLTPTLTVVVQATQQAAQPQRVQQLTGSQYQSLTPQQQQQYLQYQTYQQQQQYQSLTPQQQQQYQQILQIRRMQQLQQPSCQPQQQCSAAQAPAPAQQAALTWQEYCAAEGTGTVCIGQMACNGLVGPWLVMLRAWLSW